MDSNRTGSHRIDLKGWIRIQELDEQISMRIRICKWYKWYGLAFSFQSGWGDAYVRSQSRFYLRVCLPACSIRDRGESVDPRHSPFVHRLFTFISLLSSALVHSLYHFFILSVSFLSYVYLLLPLCPSLLLSSISLFTLSSLRSLLYA